MYYQVHRVRSHWDHVTKDFWISVCERHLFSLIRVSDLGCLWRILILFIPDPNKRGAKNLLTYLFCSHKYHKIVNYLFFNSSTKNSSQFTKNYSTFYPKNCHYDLKNMDLGSGIQDLRSGIWKKPIPGPGSRGQKGHWIPDSHHWY
jgi:hypothetical protein